MFVCVCNALREEDCRAAACHADTRGLGCIYRRLGCRVRCGACVETMREILAHARAETERAQVALDDALITLAETNLEALRTCPASSSRDIPKSSKRSTSPSRAS